jgi:hypothetical protein
MSPKTSSQLFLKKVKSFNIAKRYEKSNKICALYLNKTVLMLHSIRVQKYLRVSHISQINNDFYNCKKKKKMDK